MYTRCSKQRFRHLKSCGRLLLLLLPLSTGLAYALPDDRDQPIHISADTALRDEKQGFTVYSGNVQMSQGSMEIEADKLTIYHVDEEADKIVAEGAPAKMRQQPELEKGLVHAHAGVIEYYKREDKVHLQTNARIEQDGALVTGDSIDYFIAKQLVKADSDQTQDGKRVQVVIPPSVTQDEDEDPAANEAPTASEPPANKPTMEQDAQLESQPPQGEQQEDSDLGATDSE